MELEEKMKKKHSLQIIAILNIINEFSYIDAVNDIFIKS